MTVRPNRQKSDQLKIHITPETKATFKRAVSSNNTTMQYVLEEAIRNYIERSEKK